MSEPALEALLGRAFDRAPALDANAAIQRARETIGQGEQATSYELMLPAEGGWKVFLEQAVPRLIYFLDSRGALPPSFGRLFASIFVSDTLYFVRMADVVDLITAALGVPYGELVRRHAHPA